MFDNGRKQRDRTVAVDLGGRTTKAVSVQRRGGHFVLNQFALLDAPIFEKAMSADLLAEPLKAVSTALDTKSKSLTITVGVNDSMLRHADLPRMPVDDMRLVLKLNSKTYLQQELTNYLYDCHILPAPLPGKDAKAPTGPPRHKVLIAAARKQVVDEIVNGAKAAGFVPEVVVPALVGPANVFERSVPEVYKNEVVAIVDIGFKNSSICI